MDYALPRLTREQEQLLVRKAKAGCKRSKEKFLRHNLPLVVRVAINCKQFISAYDLEDLVSIGCIAMLEAFDFFDPDRGFKFSTVATRIISQAIHTEARKNALGHGIKIPNAGGKLDAWKQTMKKANPILRDTLSLDAPPPNANQPNLNEAVSDPRALEGIGEALFMEDVERTLTESENELVAALLEGKTHKDFNLERGLHPRNYCALGKVKKKLEWVKA